MNNPQLSPSNQVSFDFKQLIDSFSWYTFPNQSDVKTAMIDITPKLAQRILDEANSDNRNLREGAVDRYKNDMLSDPNTWKYNSDQIVFSNTYQLLNGQHRMFAIIESGQKIRLQMKFGSPDSSSVNMDSHSKRSTADHIRKTLGKNTKYAGQMGSVATCFYEYTHNGLGKGNLISPNPQVLQDIIKKHHVAFTDSLTWRKTYLKEYKIASSDVAFAHFAITNSSKKSKGVAFITELSNIIHTPLSIQDRSVPVKALQLILKREGGKKIKKGDSQWQRFQKGAYMLEAFRWYCNNEKNDDFSDPEGTQYQGFLGSL